MPVTAANLSSYIFTGAPRNLNLGAFFSSQARAMVSTKVNEKLSVAVSVNLQSGRGISKINAMESKLNVVSIKNDTRKPEDMKVDELRTTLRKFGASTKGRKQELISSLKSLLDGEADGVSSMVEDKETEISPETKTAYTETISQGKPKKQVVSLTDGVSEESKVEAVVTGKKPSSKRKLGAETSSKQVEASAAAKDSVSTNEPWTIFAHKKPQKGWVAYNPRTMRPPPLGPGVKAVKIMSWNVNGLRALLKMEGFSAIELAAREDFDVLCLQETKIQDKDVEAVKDMLEDYEHEFWTCSTSKLGYSGTAIISRMKPLSVKYGLGISDHDSEGRLVTAEFESFYLLNSYVPNSGDGLKRLSYRVSEWDAALSSYMKELEKSKPVILTGDLNCAHQEIDIYNPAGNKRSAGFTDEERQSFENCYLNKGFVDTFRKQHPGVVGYTYWGYRHGARKANRGWRLDYFLASQSIADNVHDSYILPDINGSDHCPIGLILKL